MRVLITWGSKRGGTEGIARMLADELERNGHEVTARPADHAHDLRACDAVIVGGALYANRWPANVQRFVRRNVRQLRQLPVWFFSSGPLDDSAEHDDLPPPTQVAVLAERVGALGHKTFGGRLERGATGFPAREMAKTRAGDWRNVEQIRAWADQLATALLHAQPGAAIDHSARLLPRLVLYGMAGWAACSAVLVLLSALASPGVGAVAQALLAPVLLAVLARSYFGARGSRVPLQVATVWAAIFATLHLVVVGGLVLGAPGALLADVGVFWVPLVLGFFATWVTGGIMSTLPWPKAPDAPRGAVRSPAGTPARRPT